MGKLISMGDCIIDFLPAAPGSMTYTAKTGGAPVNVCAAVAKLGKRRAFSANSPTTLSGDFC